MLYRWFRYLSRFLIMLGRGPKYAILLSVDVILVPVSLLMSIYLYGDGLWDEVFAQPATFALLAVGLSAAGAAVSAGVGLPRIKLNAYENKGIQRTAVFAVLVGSLGFLGMSALIEIAPQLRIVAIFTLVMVVLSVAARIVLRNILLRMYQDGQDRHRILIYGAGQTGLQLATALFTDETIEAVAFIDDNPALKNFMVAGLPVHSPIKVEALIKDLNIDRVVLAMPSISHPKQARIAQRLAQVGCDISKLPSFAALVGEGALIDKIQPANPSDFLNRANHEADLNGETDIYARRTVMITGAGGSIGSELTRQILVSRPAKLVLFDVSEIALYQLTRELEELGLIGTTAFVGVLGSVSDAKTVRRIMAEHSVEIVLHAAAYKHVNIVETNILAGLNNNVLGTRVVAAAARDAGVGHFILVSTDKAVRPTSVMGASKRLAELVVQDLASRAEGTKFSIVRFGNVLGSSGSVVPLFAEQIARGGPVTLTHNDVTRYFMTLSEASRLVLLAGNFTRGGDIFVLDMGEPVSIRNLAVRMIEAAGHTVCDTANPDGDIEITIRGLMPGEKLHEELVGPGYSLIGTDNSKIFATNETGLSEIEVASAIQTLEQAIDAGDPDAARAVLHRWVGQYRLDPDNNVSRDRGI